MSIKYYQLAKDEELPDEFCAVRDVGGEPSEYTFYVPEAENVKLREEFESVGTAAYLYGRSDLKAENAKLREARGTCHVECYDDGIDEDLDGEWYSYALPTWYLSCEHEAYGVECPSFCPVCGRQIVDEEESE